MLHILLVTNYSAFTAYYNYLPQDLKDSLIADYSFLGTYPLTAVDMEALLLTEKSNLVGVTWEDYSVNLLLAL